MAKVYSLDAGTKLPGGILDLAAEEKVETAKVEAIGGVDELTLAYYNLMVKRYEEHDYEEFLEVTSLLGNITLKDGMPFLHAHGTFGKRDMSVIGGHLIKARVSPVLEVILLPTTNRALRQFDEPTGLNLIHRT